MDEAAALRATIAAHPEADLPRLVYADWLEDGGDDGQAAMIRTQVQLAHEPAWSSLAVRCRHHTPEILTGKPWRHTLPDVSPRIAAWHPETPFRRGAPDWLVVRDLASFLDDAGRLFDLAPITTLSLPTSSLDYWQEFARRPWLRQVRALHFYGVSTPIEPLRVLANAVNASSVEELTLERTSGPAFPVVLGDLFQSDLGKRLKHLDLRAGGDNDGEWLEAFSKLPASHALEGLDLRTMAFGGQRLHILAESECFGRLRRFHVHNDRILRREMRVLMRRGGVRSFEDVAFRAAIGGHETLQRMSRSVSMRGVQRLDLSRQPMFDLSEWSQSEHLGDVVSLNLAECFRSRDHFLTRDAELAPIVAMRCWPKLVELDLCGNRTNELSLKTLLDAKPPDNLVALRLTGIGLASAFRAKLQSHFNGAVSFYDNW